MLSTIPRTSLLLVLVVVGSAVLARPASAAGHRLAVKIVFAHDKAAAVDPKLEGLVKELSALKFKGFELKDEATFELETGSTGRMQLPSKQWMTITPLEVSQDGKLKLDFEVKELKFKTTVTLKTGATLAVGGPAYDGGAIILAVTRPTKP